MGLTAAGMHMLAPYIRNVKALSLGYPDIVMTAKQVENTLDITVEKWTEFGLWHGDRKNLPETIDLFAKLNSTLDCVDRHASRGCERIVDLNYPVVLGEYDVVIDAGTTEHCFNIAQAMINAAEAVKVGGIIFHSPPLSMVNHGFYCVMPTMLNDFYTQNGWSIEQMSLYMDGKLFVPAPTTERINVPPEASTYCIAKRLTDKPMKYPVQAKYLKSPDLIRRTA